MHADNCPQTGRKCHLAFSLDLEERHDLRTELAGTTGLEPATSDVTGRRSNQLNYVPAFLFIVTRDRRPGSRARGPQQRMVAAAGRPRNAPTSLLPFAFCHLPFALLFVAVVVFLP